MRRGEPGHVWLPVDAASQELELRVSLLDNCLKPLAHMRLRIRGGATSQDSSTDHQLCRCDRLAQTGYQITFPLRVLAGLCVQDHAGGGGQTRGLLVPEVLLRAQEKTEIRHETLIGVKDQAELVAPH